MIMLKEKYLNYALIQCADEERDESLNVGLVVFDADSGEVGYRLVDSFDRVHQTLPSIPVAHIRHVLSVAADHLATTLPEVGFEAFAASYRDTAGAVRVGRIRTLLSHSVEHAADDLYHRYVGMAVVGRKEPRRIESNSPQVAYDPVTSRRVIGTIRTRLRRRKLREGRDYRSDQSFFGLTKNHVQVPVFFPLEVGRTDAPLRLYIDGIEVKADENRTLNDARALAQKSEETYRVLDRVRVVVAIRDNGDTETGQFAESIIAGDGAQGGLAPIVRRYTKPEELDDVLSGVLELALPAIA
jgi:hypothetical protein